MPNWNPNTRIDDSINNFSTGEGLILIAEGDYLFQLSRVVPSPSTRDYARQDPFIRFDFKIVEGPDALGKTIGYTGMITPKKEDGSGGSWSLGRVLNAIGMDPSKFEDRGWKSWEEFAAFVQALSARLQASPPRTGGTVTDDTATRNSRSQMVSNITAFWPADEWDERTKPRTESAAASGPARGRARTSTATAVAEAPAAEANGTAPSEAPADEAGLSARLDSLFKAG